jgi:outer membrane protein OmpA-like peptidoglycan-associated protein
MLTTQGYGETKPVASNDTPDGRLQNRRTEFAVAGPATTTTKVNP